MTRDVWTYLAESAGWTLLGFLGGFLVGRAVRDVHRIASALTPEENPVSPSQSRRRSSALSGQFVLGMVVVLLGIVTVVQGVVTSNATQRLTECQSAYSNGFADALEARSNSSAEAQHALDELVKTIGDTLSKPPPVPPEVMRSAITDYLAKRAQSDAQRQHNPYPPPPRDLCH